MATTTKSKNFLLMSCRMSDAPENVTFAFTPMSSNMLRVSFADSRDPKSINTLRSRKRVGEVTGGAIDEVAVVKDGDDVQRIRLPLTQSQSLKGLQLPHPAHVCEYWHDGPCLQSPFWKPKHA